MSTGAWSHPRLMSLSVGMRCYIVLMITIAAGWSIAAIATSRLSDYGHIAFVLALILAVVFEEISHRSSRVRIRLGSQLSVDMTSVWTASAAIALPAGPGVVLLTSLLLFLWWRQQAPGGHLPHRALFTAASYLIACLVAGTLARHWSVSDHGGEAAIAQAVRWVVVIALASAVNRGVVMLALIGSGERGRALLGEPGENLVELATLCLGGLVGLAMVEMVWLTPLVVIPMITLQRGALLSEFETAATTDAKTGVFSAAAWNHLAEREFERAERENVPLAVLIIDIDHFKSVNDRFGHLVGDVVLRAVARCLERGVRTYDTVARFGGEEFVAVLPNANDAEALVVAARLRSAVNRIRVSQAAGLGDDVSDDAVSVSIGVAVLGADGDDVTGLLHSADSALYRAKHMGRNRVELAPRDNGEEAVRSGG